MARRTPDFSRIAESAVAASPPEPVRSAPEAPAGEDDIPAGDASTSAPTLVAAEALAAHDAIAEVPPTDPPPVERYRVETNVYYVPSLGYGAVFVPAGTIVTRVSHDLQKLVAQGGQLRPID